MTTIRRIARIAVVALALAAAGCSSNNAGKIVGRWKADGVDLPISPKGPADIVWEFTEDGTFTITRILTGRPEPVVERLATGRYSLGVQDNVSITALDPPIEGKKTRVAEKIVIEGDRMTVGGRGTDPTYRFVRVP